MGVLENAAQGAASGGLLAGPTGALIGGGLGVVSSLLGGLFGSSAQSSANRANLQVARETNALHERLFNQQIGENWKMFEAANEWNSPVQQRARLEQAGYNPAALFSQNGAMMSSPIAAPGAPNLATPQVQPVDALGKGIAGAVGSGLSALTSLAEARKLNADAHAQEITNVHLGHRVRSEALKAGSDAEIADLDAAERLQTYNDRVAGVHSEALVKQETYENLKAEKALKDAQSALAYSQIGLNDTEKDRLAKLASLYVQQAKTEVTQQELNKMLGFKAHEEGKLAAATRWINSFLAEHQAGLMDAQAVYYRESGAGLQIENAVKRKYANAEKVIGLAREISQMNVNNATIKELEAAAAHHGVQASQGQLQMLQSALKAATGLGMVTTMYGDLWPLMYMGNMLK